MRAGSLRVKSETDNGKTAILVHSDCQKIIFTYSEQLGRLRTAIMVLGNIRDLRALLDIISLGTKVLRLSAKNAELGP
jgi:hypothetical protein